MDRLGSKVMLIHRRRASSADWAGRLPREPPATVQSRKLNGEAKTSCTVSGSNQQGASFRFASIICNRQAMIESSSVTTMLIVNVSRFVFRIPC
jgi:hypothetical protein